MATPRFEHPSAAPVVLLLPDLDCGARGYWQEHWLTWRLDCRGVDLGHAHAPDRNSCVSRLDRACRGIDAPIILVGHGIGALTIAAWAGLMSRDGEAPIAGALLIAPWDAGSESADRRLHSFAPLPDAVFTFPALLVASRDDPGVGIERAFSLARQWGAGFADVGNCGHFAPADGFGWWPEGELLLDRFIELTEAGRNRRITPAETLASPLRRSGNPRAGFLFRP